MGMAIWKTNDLYLKCKLIYKTMQTATKIISEYDQEIPQSQTADNPVAPRGRAAQPSKSDVK